jgi:hypothetical protein
MPASLHCPSCGAEAGVGALFCASCGRSLTDAKERPGPGRIAATTIMLVAAGLIIGFLFEQTEVAVVIALVIAAGYAVVTLRR